jgi:hypothetical protein
MPPLGATAPLAARRAAAGAARPRGAPARPAAAPAAPLRRCQRTPRAAALAIARVPRVRCHSTADPDAPGPSEARSAEEVRPPRRCCAWTARP